MSKLYSRLRSLEEGNWFKLICGASFQHLPSVRSLVLAYTLAGADCIDVAADAAVIAAAKEAIEVAKNLAETATSERFEWQGPPLIMASLNDDEDPHFRKAEFDPNLCPSDCPRPCEKVCPANAIVFNGGESSSGQIQQQEFSGIIAPRCYGCGRCLPVCPSQLIQARSYQLPKRAIAPLQEQTNIDAIEIHTSVGHERAFKELWSAIAPLSYRLKLLAISCQDGSDLLEYLHFLYETIAPLPCALIWQTDGRPMSGDIGAGATRAAIELARKVLAANLPGYVQLAGGTNHHTVTKLEATGLLRKASPKNRQPTVSGVAYGSYARSLLSPILEKLETMERQNFHTNSVHLAALKLEDHPELLEEAVAKAKELVLQLKPVSA